MKKTLITLMALAGVACAYTDTPYQADHELSSSVTYADDYRVLLAGSAHANGNADGSASITTDGDVTIYEINGSGLDKVNSVTYNLGGEFHVTGVVKPTTNNNCTFTLNLGNNGSFVAQTGNDQSLTFGAGLTINAGLAAGQSSHSLLSSDFINLNFNTSLTLNVTTPEGYKYGGMVFYYAASDAYYAASDVSRASNGNWYYINAGAKEIDLYEDTVYTIARMNANITQTASVKNLSLAIGDTSIPEPTTATLSLLALAGLAARRRRH